MKAILLYILALITLSLTTAVHANWCVFGQIRLDISAPSSGPNIAIENVTVQIKCWNHIVAKYDDCDNCVNKRCPVQTWVSPQSHLQTHSSSTMFQTSVGGLVVNSNGGTYQKYFPGYVPIAYCEGCISRITPLEGRCWVRSVTIVQDGVTYVAYGPKDYNSDTVNMTGTFYVLNYNPIIQTFSGGLFKKPVQAVRKN